MHNLISLEIDLIKDFMVEGGKLFYPAAKKILPAVEILSKKIEESNIPRFVVRDFHFEDDPEMEIHQQHAMAYTGDCKIIDEVYQDTAFFCLPDKVVEGQRFNWEPYVLDALISNKIHKFIVEKQSYSTFSNPAMPILVDKLNATDAIVYGVYMEYCVKETVLDAHSHGIQCHIVEDAIAGIDEHQSRITLETLKTAGAKVISLGKALEML